VSGELLTRPADISLGSIVWSSFCWP